MTVIRTRHGLQKPPAKKSANPDADDDDDLSPESIQLFRESIRLCFLIYDVARMHRNAFDEFMEPMGITREQWSVLAQLSRHDGESQIRLAKLLEIPRAQAGIIIALLEASGWVERREDPTDKRVKRVYLKRSAHKVIKQMRLLAGQFGDRILGGLSADERVELGRMLRAVKTDIARSGSSGRN